MKRQGQTFAFDRDIALGAGRRGVRRKMLTFDAGVMMVRVAFEAGASAPALASARAVQPRRRGRLRHYHRGPHRAPCKRRQFPRAVECRPWSGRDPGRLLLDVFTPMREDFVGAGT